MTVIPEDVKFPESLFVVSIDDRHLHFEVGPDGSCGQPRFWAQFPSVWSGCRLSHGVLQGRVSFEVRLERKLMTPQPEEAEVVERCGVRVGWSVANTSLLLGKEQIPQLNFVFVQKLLMVPHFYLSLVVHLSHTRSG